MRVSLNWVKKYVNLPANLKPEQISYDLTLRTVEVESIEHIKEKFHDIVVGKLLEIRKHPNADLLKICITDIGEEKPVQIVCGGSNLYEGEYVVVAKPGAEVVWHGEGEPVIIKETKMRGESSYGMICAASEVYLDKYFNVSYDHEIVDLKDMKCQTGQNVADVLGLDDVILEIDNKSLTNRPDLWGHYGIARELSAIYDASLVKLPEAKIDANLPKYEVEIKESDKCRRYTAIEIENVYEKESPLWMKNLIINGGMRPINAIVDITNYVMMAVGQPLHAFDRTHVDGEKIIVRNAKKGEKLLLLDGNAIELTEDDLVICDINDAMALAGIKGGKKDSILPDTTGIVLEVANFAAGTIRKTGKRFAEKTDASIRYEKNIDTDRIDQGIALALQLFKEIFPKSKVVSYGDVCNMPTKREKIEVPKEFLDIRLGKVIDDKIIQKILKALGYEVEYENGIYHVVAPVWRSTGDVSLKEDVLGDIARLLSFESFDAKPLPVNFEHAVIQNKISLERGVREYLAYRCGFNEIFTYPWVDEKYIYATKESLNNVVKLATPPAPELSMLRKSLIPGMLETISKNLRYFETFKIFEMAQVFEKGKYHESSEDETLPIHKKYLTGSIIGKDPKNIFYEAKGVIEDLARYCHMDKLELVSCDKPSWADVNAYLGIKCNNEVIGYLGLVSTSVMTESKIKRTNIALFEVNFDKFVPFASRTNKFEHLPQFPLVEKDLSLVMDSSITWEEISNLISPMVKELEFIEEYHGNQIPEGKKSIMLRFKIGNDDSTMDSEQITNKMNSIIKKMNKVFGAELREE